MLNLVMKHITLLLFIGLAFWHCEDIDLPNACNDMYAPVCRIWIIFFNLLGGFFLLAYELYNSFHGESKSLYKFYSSFQNIGLSVGLIFIGLSLFFVSRSIVKRIFFTEK